MNKWIGYGCLGTSIVFFVIFWGFFIVTGKAVW